jgi:DNA polymerase/3'-5' exonuclease PolX
MLDADGVPWLRVAGSLRRGKPEVGDVEMVYVPASGDVQNGLFVEQGNVFDAALETLILRRIIAPRKNAKGVQMWGGQNKFAVHVASGLPLDFFATTAPAFFNYLVCRTGGKESNVALAVSAAERGLKWHPYHSGFEVVDCERAQAALNRPELTTGRFVVATSERAVFELAGLAYLEPWERA